LQHFRLLPIPDKANVDANGWQVCSCKPAVVILGDMFGDEGRVVADTRIGVQGMSASDPNFHCVEC
jgi:hypothetical protein